jgi:hypothetical protein
MSVSSFTFLLWQEFLKEELRPDWQHHLISTPASTSRTFTETTSLEDDVVEGDDTTGRRNADTIMDKPESLHELHKTDMSHTISVPSNLSNQQPDSCGPVQASDQRKHIRHVLDLSGTPVRKGSLENRGSPAPNLRVSPQKQQTIISRDGKKPANIQKYASTRLTGSAKVVTQVNSRNTGKVLLITHGLNRNASMNWHLATIKRVMTP